MCIWSFHNFFRSSEDRRNRSLWSSRFQVNKHNQSWWQLNQEKEGKLGKGRNADRAPCLAVERLETIAQFNERFGQGQTTRQGIGWNQNKSVPFSKMSNKQQHGKLTQLTRQEAEDKRIAMLLKYNMQNGFLNWGKLEMEMECSDLTWKIVLTKYIKIDYCRLDWIHNSTLCQHQITFDFGAQQKIWVVGFVGNRTV